MKWIVFISLAAFSMSCQALPQLFQATEDIADDTAIKMEVSKEAISRQTDLNLQMNVSNKDKN